MRDPRELYEIVDDTPVDDAAPVMFYSLAGFMDAGQASALAAESVADNFERRLVAQFDVDELIDYRSRRPAMTFSGDRYTQIEQFSLTLEALADPSGRQLYLLRGPEPDFQWERFAAGVGQLVDRFGVKLAVTGHGIPWAAPHTRPLRTTAHASRRELIAGSPRWFDDVRVPGNMVGMLELRLGEAGVDSVGFAVHVPHYLSDIEFPPAAVSLLDSIAEVAGLELPTQVLRDAGADVLAKVDEQVAQSPQLQEAIAGMEKAFDADSGELSLGSGQRLPESEIPGGDAIAAEVEDFLRGMGG